MAMKYFPRNRNKAAFLAFGVVGNENQLLKPLMLKGDCKSYPGAPLRPQRTWHQTPEPHEASLEFRTYREEPFGHFIGPSNFEGKPKSSGTKWTFLAAGILYSKSQATWAAGNDHTRLLRGKKGDAGRWRTGRRGHMSRGMEQALYLGSFKLLEVSGRAGMPNLEQEKPCGPGQVFELDLVKG